MREDSQHSSQLMPDGWATRRWLQAQALEGIAASALQVLRMSGWIPSAGSAGPYLSFRVRMPGGSRVELDDEIFEGDEIREVPAVRDCFMLVPRDEVWLALACARRAEGPRLERLARCCGVGEQEVSELAASIASILQRGPQTSESLRHAVPSRQVRSLGNAGKRLGDTSTFSVALRRLLIRGDASRIRSGRRLEGREFEYRWEGAGRKKPEVTAEELNMELARRFFRWSGPATVKEFAWWAGITQREGSAAAAGAGLTRIELPGWTQSAWIHREVLDIRDASTDRNGKAILLPFRDNYVYHRRGMKSLVRPMAGNALVSGWNQKASKVAELDSLHNHAILSGGEIVGIWDFDRAQGTIVWALLFKGDRRLRAEVAAVVGETEAFVREQLSDLDFYSMDNAANRSRRLAEIRALKNLTAI